jgi:hypothetical protein
MEETGLYSTETIVTGVFTSVVSSADRAVCLHDKHVIAIADASKKKK